MHLEGYRQYCLAKRGAEESFPFDDDTLVYKVGGRIFSLAPIAPFDRFSVKCDPLHAIELRATYEGVQPGYHMNKKHWNTVHIDSDVPLAALYRFLDNSYEAVVARLPRTIQASL